MNHRSHLSQVSPDARNQVQEAFMFLGSPTYIGDDLKNPLSYPFSAERQKKGWQKINDNFVLFLLVVLLGDTLIWTC